MALASNQLDAPRADQARGNLRRPFGRFAVAAVAAFVTSEVVLTLCAGPLNVTSTWAGILSWFSGAVVSYVLSRWAWKRKGRPDLLRETVPFWIVSAMVVAILTVATKFGYHSAGWLNLHHTKRLLYVDAVYGVANIGTFLLRFLFFHYVLFAGSAGRVTPAVADEAVASADPGPEPFAMTEGPESGKDTDPAR